MSPILVGELLVSHSVSVRKITTSDQITGGDKNLDLVYMNPRVLYSINVFTLSRPTNSIHAPNHHGAVGYMIERLKGRPSFQTDTSRAKDLELAFKSVAYANEFGSLTRTSVQADQAAVHTLLEALEDRINARFRGLYAKANIVMIKRNSLFEWKFISFTRARIAKKQTTGSQLGRY